VKRAVEVMVGEPPYPARAGRTVV